MTTLKTKALFDLGETRHSLGLVKDAMAQIRHPHAAYMAGTGPTAADNCAQVFEMLEHGLTMLETYMAGEP